MNVVFLAYGPVRDVIGAKEIDHELPEGATVGDLLTNLSEEYPDLDEQLYTDGTLSKTISITVNGTNLDRIEGLETELSEGDEVRVAPPIRGGR